MIFLVRPRELGEPVDDGVVVGPISERVVRDTSESTDELPSHARHASQECGEALAASGRHRSRVEAIGSDQVVEPVDAIQPSPPDQIESADRLLLPGDDMSEEVLDRPPVERARSPDLFFGKP
jgi:hypothetical protein